ncbi:MAG: hypothetical protein EZS28_008449 [Streblomastix strix]|uniref:Uncharacterized protein n=1 Tax=Streblomastix strix TaxID=222440 RepID=A0A5J4WM25_9EUKA|nr:MAG: hypothetical protein EZS28_008449 [Streblomastix strix]
MRLRQTDNEKQILDPDFLLNNVKSQVPLPEQNFLKIQKRRAIEAKLVMVFTVARLAELHRATLHSAMDDKICPLRWFKSWFADREPVIPNEAQEL